MHVFIPQEMVVAGSGAAKEQRQLKMSEWILLRKASRY